MKCITRNKMKFNELVIPARTKGTIIWPLKSFLTPNVPGVSVGIAIALKDIDFHNKDVNNELEKETLYGYTKNQMDGITFSTKTNQIYIIPEYMYYDDYKLSLWQAGKILDKEKLDEIEPKFAKYPLFEIIETLEEEFADWVTDNCKFKKITKREAENYLLFEAGDKVLVDQEKFANKKLEYQKRLETSGFTYNFKGGLIWE